MKKHILVKNKEEIFARNNSIRKDDWTLIGENFFEACEYDEQTNILGANYVAYGIAKTRQSLNSPAVPYIEAFTDAENLEIQQDLQKRLCVSEMKRLIKAKMLKIVKYICRRNMLIRFGTNQEIRFHNKEYGIEGAGKSLKEAIETFINDSVESFVKNDIDPRGVKEEDREISFYNVEDCEVYLPKKYVDKIWDEIEDRFEDAEIDEATRAEKFWEMNEGR